MERLSMENFHHSQDTSHYRHDDQVARIMDRRPSKLSRLYQRGLARLGDLMVSWGSRLQQHHEAMIPTSTEGNPSPC
jgi:hypothetical protein